MKNYKKILKLTTTLALSVCMLGAFALPSYASRAEEKSSSIIIGDIISRNMVVLYKDGDFGGAFQFLTPGRYTADQFSNVGNDQLSSLKIPEGFMVTLYEHGDFTGKTLTLKNVTDVGWLSHFNDITSAIEIVRL